MLSTGDDRVLAYTRALSAVIVPFLVGAWVILYLFPDDTKRLFAWTIRPTMTPMVLASAYLGGAYFFVRVLRERHWHAVKTGFLAVTLFATLLGVATILHWDKFNHRHVTFWIWVVLYFSTPFLVSAAGWRIAGMRRRQGPTRRGWGAWRASSSPWSVWLHCSKASSCSPPRRWSSRTGRGY